MDTQYAKLHPIALGLVLGFLWGLSVAMLGIVALHFDYAVGFVSALSHLYIGFKTTPLGIVIGMLWGFLDFFVFGLLIGWLYNQCLNCSYLKPSK